MGAHLPAALTTPCLGMRCTQLDQDQSGEERAPSVRTMHGHRVGGSWRELLPADLRARPLRTADELSPPPLLMHQCALTTPFGATQIDYDEFDEVMAALSGGATLRVLLTLLLTVRAARSHTRSYSFTHAPA
jgi:hypothetical protein